MLCSKCYQKISQGEEIQIKGSTICKKCALDNLAEKEVIERCHECFKLICKNEIIHEVYENWGTESSEKLIKCQPCYEKWLKIAKLKRRAWEAMRWFENSFLPFIMWSTLAIITLSKNKEHVGKVPFVVVLMLIIATALLSPFTFALIRKIIEIKYRKKKRKRK
ncbi:MAG: hypothetical protein MRERV_6c011 [Mycoplasmataceae bacterium RV_VA103A]|nr:MAG: hypothetical protein MRERV_47c003 [Mycoplasmataceae bacterium RV_VA103A]KLL05042.1 MAG: hypothetical protein MRERV_6c011 [Mycoplasmataceae bacterium RV_VA103A]